MTAMTQAEEDLLERLFHEIPAAAPAYVAMSAYFLGGLIALVLTVKTKAWFMVIATVVAWLEALGFVLRLIVISSPTLGMYIGMQALLIITPVILPLINYLVVGKLMMLGDATQLRFKPSWVARVFTASDIFCLSLQGAGGGLISSVDEAARRNGTNLMLVGLFLQLVFFTGFTYLTIWVQHSNTFGLRSRPQLRDVFIGLYSTIILMYIRNIFRVIEFIMGYDGYLASHEEFFYVFDFAMICSCIFLYCVYHFGLHMAVITTPHTTSVEKVSPATELPSAVPPAECSGSSSSSCCHIKANAVKPYVNGPDGGAESMV